MQGSESLTFSGMTYRVEFEFQIEQDTLAIFTQFTQILAQRIDTLLDGR